MPTISTPSTASSNPPRGAIANSGPASVVISAVLPAGGLSDRALGKSHVAQVDQLHQRMRRFDVDDLRAAAGLSLWRSSSPPGGSRPMNSVLACGISLGLALIVDHQVVVARRGPLLDTPWFRARPATAISTSANLRGAVGRQAPASSASLPGVTSSTRLRRGGSTAVQASIVDRQSRRRCACAASSTPPVHLAQVEHHAARVARRRARRVGESISASSRYSSTSAVDALGAEVLQPAKGLQLVACRPRGAAC